MTMTDRLPDLFNDTPARATDHHVPTFDEWWERWPKKQGKAKARQHWARMSVAERASAWAALPGWERLARIDGTTFIPYGSTWLNQQRWEDDAPEPKATEERSTAPGMAAVRRILDQGGAS